MKYYIYKHGDYGFKTVVKKLSGIQFERLRLFRMAGAFSGLLKVEREWLVCARNESISQKAGSLLDGFCIVVIQVTLLKTD